MKLLKSTLLMGCLFASAASFAQVYDSEASDIIEYDTYFGLGLKYQWIKPRSQWEPLLVSNREAFVAYWGWRFHPNFSVEFGYEGTRNRPRGVTVAPGGSLLGITNNTTTAIMVNGKVRLKTGYADLNAYIPFRWLCDYMPEVILSAGISNVRPRQHFFVTPDLPALESFTNPFKRGLHGVSGLVWRAGLGLQTLVVEHFGVRAMYRWERTSVLRVTQTAGLATSLENLFGNSHSVAVSIFYNW